MRPVTVEHVVSQYFAQMATQGVVGNINAPKDTPEYWVGRYGNYQPFGHAGMDFKCPVGTRVYAMADGVVLHAGWGYNLPGTGNVRKWLLYKDFPGIVTVIQHTGWIGVYAHLSDNDMAPAGTPVKMGQLIALSGNTGGVDPHLHVEALVDLSYKTGGGLIYGRTDPSKFFGGGLATQGTITEPAQEEPLVPNESDRVFWPIEGEEKVSLNELLNSIDRKATAANAAIASLFAIQLPDPTEPGKTYALADWIVWAATNAKLAAGAAGVAAGNTSPDALTKAVTEAQAGTTAQAIANQLQISVKESPNG